MNTTVAERQVRPLAVRQIIECLRREHCWSGAGCPYQRGCNGGPAESLGMTGVLMEYIEWLEAEVVAYHEEDDDDPRSCSISRATAAP